MSDSGWLKRQIDECAETSREALKEKIVKLQSQLEAERAKVRELREVLLYYRDECSGAEPSISVFERKLDEALSKTSTAPTEAEIRAQRDREIADWLESSAKEYEAAGMEVPYPASRLQELANELRQRADGKTES